MEHVYNQALKRLQRAELIVAESVKAVEYARTHNLPTVLALETAGLKRKNENLEACKRVVEELRVSLKLPAQKDAFKKG